MQLYLKKALFAIIILVLPTCIFSQYIPSEILEGFKIQPKLAGNVFYGDLVHIGKTNYTFGIAAEREMKPYLNARFDLNFGSMRGTQINDGQTYFYFNNVFIFYNIGASFRPLDLAFGLFKQRLFNPYIVGQVGAIQYNSKKFVGEAGARSLSVLIPEIETGDVYDETGGFKVAPTVSLGGGVNYYINSHISITAEIIATLPFSDELDLHERWVNPLTGVWTKTADPYDFFYISSLGVTYLFYDSKWKNSPKYNRKAYIRTRSLYKTQKPKKYKRPKRRNTKRYK
jgi:hypothetical protein